MKITIKNIIKENIDPEEKYINKLSGILKPPYFYNLIVTETPENLWSRILSKVFNQEVTHYIWVNNDNNIFNSNNNLIYKEDYDGYWEKYEYDSNNNQIYNENSDGDWYKREYDSNNNQIYYEDNNGYWIKREYDSNNNQLYNENSDGYWEKREYDFIGNRIYYENSDGEIIDNRSSNPINENIDPEEKYINKLSSILKPPYFYNLIVTETPTYLWNKILSKIFNQEVTQYFGVNSDNLIFNSNGNVIYREYSNGYWEKREYNSKGNLIYYENSDGYWEKREYESKGNLIYYENSDGEIKEYDSNGNKIYSENSNGYWYKREYDSNDNLIYYEDSDGYWIKLEYDSNNKLIYRENSNGVLIDRRSSNTINEYGQF